MAQCGYVALLREVKHIPRELALAIASGLDADAYLALQQQQPECAGRLAVGKDDFSLPLGILRSPDIEHLMQEFSWLFGRIGIEDLDPIDARSLFITHFPSPTDAP